MLGPEKRAELAERVSELSRELAAVEEALDRAREARDKASVYEFQEKKRDLEQEYTEAYEQWHEQLALLGEEDEQEPERQKSVRYVPVRLPRLGPPRPHLGGRGGGGRRLPPLVDTSARTPKHARAEPVAEPGRLPGADWAGAGDTVPWHEPAVEGSVRPSGAQLQEATLEFQDNEPRKDELSPFWLPSEAKGYPTVAGQLRLDNDPWLLRDPLDQPLRDLALNDPLNPDPQLPELLPEPEREQ